MVQITVNLSQQSYEQIKELAEYQNTSVEQALEKAAENIHEIFDNSLALSLLPDHIIVQMAHSKMDAAENDRMYELQHLDRPKALNSPN